MNSADTLRHLPEVVESDTERFQVLALLGQGGMGIVLKARQERLDRIVALKMLHPSRFAEPGVVQRLKREAIAAATMSHPNIVGVYSLGLQQGQPFIVMEYVEGQSLDEIIRNEKQISVERAYDIFLQLLDGLGCIHKAGFVHRDIKPSNVIVTTDGVAKFMDFGIAKSVELGAGQRVTQTGVMIGSPWYMSPEQCGAGTVDARSDIYSLGCTMYEALSGKPPFGGDNMMEVMFMQLHEQADTLSDRIDPRIADIIAKAMSKNQEDRFRSAEEFKTALLECKGGEYIPSGRRRRAKFAGLSRTHFAIVLAGLATLAAVLGLSLTIFQKPSAEPPPPVQAKVSSNSVPLMKTLLTERMSIFRAAELGGDILGDIRELPESVPQTERIPQFKLVAKRLREVIAADTSGSSAGLFRATLILGDAESQFDRKSAQTNYLRSLELAKKLSDDNPDERVMAYMKVLGFLREEADRKNFQAVRDDALQYLSNFTGDSPEAEAAEAAVYKNDMMFSAAVLGDYKRAFALAEKSLKIGRKLGMQNEYDYADTLTYVAQYYVELGKPAEAIKVALSALPLSKRNLTFPTHKDDYFLGERYHEQCMILAREYCKLKQYSEARKYFALAIDAAARIPLPAYSRSNDYYILAGNLAPVDIAAAADAAEKAVEVCREDPRVINGDMGYYCLMRYAQVLHSLGQYQKGYQVAREAENVSTACVLPAGQFAAAAHQGLMLFMLRDYAAAVEAFGRAQQLEKQFKLVDPVTSFNTAHYCAVALMRLKRFVEADANFKLAERIIRRYPGYIPLAAQKVMKTEQQSMPKSN